MNSKYSIEKLKQFGQTVDICGNEYHMIYDMSAQRIYIETMQKMGVAIEEKSLYNPTPQSILAYSCLCHYPDISQIDFLSYEDWISDQVLGTDYSIITICKELNEAALHATTRSMGKTEKNEPESQTKKPHSKGSKN